MTEIIVLVDVVKAVAEHLDGFAYLADEGDGNPSLKHSDGRELLFRIGTYGQEDGRLIISGQLPRDNGRFVEPREFDANHQKVEFRTSITVARDKLPQRIASDIKKRLLPDYDRAFANVQAQIVNLRAGVAKRDAVAQRLGEVIGVQPTLPRNGDSEATLYCPGLPFGTIRVSSGGSIRFEYFYCDADQAEAIIRSVKP